MESEITGNQPSAKAPILLLAIPNVLMAAGVVGLAVSLWANLGALVVAVSTPGGTDFGSVVASEALSSMIIFGGLIMLGAIAYLPCFIVSLVKFGTLSRGSGESSGLVTAGFVLGILGVSVLAIPFGIAGLAKKVSNYGQAVGAIALGIVSLFWVALLGGGAFYFTSTPDGVRTVTKPVFEQTVTEMVNKHLPQSDLDEYFGGSFDMGDIKELKNQYPEQFDEVCTEFTKFDTKAAAEDLKNMKSEYGVTLPPGLADNLPAVLDDLYAEYCK